MLMSLESILAVSVISMNLCTASFANCLVPDSRLRASNMLHPSSWAVIAICSIDLLPSFLEGTLAILLNDMSSSKAIRRR